MQTMTSKQRLLTAIHHQEPDLVPVAPRIGAFLQEYYGHSGWMYDLKAAAEFDFDPIIFVGSPYPNYISAFLSSYTDLEDVKVQINIERLADCTIYHRFITTPAGKLSDSIKQYKGGVGYGSSPNPHWEERLLKTESDLECLTYLLPKPNVSAYEPIVETQRAIGERGLLNLYINSPIDHQAGWAMELVDMMVAVYEQPELVSKLLRLYQNYTLTEIRCACEAGVDVIFIPWYFASLSAGWSPHLFHELFVPLIKEQVDLVHHYGKIYHYYDDGKCSAILPWLKECAVDLISTVPPFPIGDVNLKEAKAAVGDRICLNGNIDLINVIAKGSEQEIRDAVRQAILDAAPGGGFILGTSDSIRDAPIENVRTYFQAARAFGDYCHLGI